MSTAIVELGNHNRLNAAADGHGITYLHVPLPDEDGIGGYRLDEGLDVEAFRSHLDAVMRQPGNRQGVTNWDPAHEAFINAVHPFGHLPNHFQTGLKGTLAPAWVKAGNDDPKSVLLTRYLSEWFQVDAFRSEALPPGYHELYHRRYGNFELAPGVVPGTLPVEALVTNIGRGLWINSMGGLSGVGYAGSATATSATSLTGTGTPWTIHVWKGCIVVCTTTGVFGVISDNTTSALTVDQWYNPATPGGAAGSTPGSTEKFVIMQGSAASLLFMGISTTNITPAAGDTALSGEATANGMGRKICTSAITSSTSPAAFTQAATFTYTSSGALTFYADAMFSSNVKATANDAVSMGLETLFNASATVTATSDAITNTETVTGP